MPANTCSVEDCERPINLKGRCRTHYKRLLRFGPDDPRTDGPIGRYKTDGCASPGCEKPHFAGGYCRGHSQRPPDRRDTPLRPYGVPKDPTIPKRRTPGIQNRLLRELAANPRDTDDCVYIDAYRARLNGRQVTASRALWIFTHGDPGKRLVLHTCDNGPGCLNIRHLYLGTTRQNKIDDAIRRVWGKQLSVPELAEKFGISEDNVLKVIQGEPWTLED